MGKILRNNTRDAHEISREGRPEYPAEVCKQIRKIIMGGEYRSIVTGAFCSQAATGSRKQKKTQRQKERRVMNTRRNKYINGARMENGDVGTCGLGM